MKQNKPIIIGLTGGIATGKSTVSDILKANGVIIIDADVIAREVVSINSVGLEAVINCFGKDILNDDQTLNRRKLGNIVFNDEKKLNQLNNLLHPLIKARVLTLIDQYTANEAELVVLDAALLIEAGWNQLVDLIILVDLDEEIQIKRLMTRNHLTRDDAKKIIAKQAKKEYKRQFADKMIMNNGSKEELEQKTMQVLREIRREINK